MKQKKQKKLRFLLFLWLILKAQCMFMQKPVDKLNNSVFDELIQKKIRKFVHFNYKISFLKNNMYEKV